MSNQKYDMAHWKNIYLFGDENTSLVAISEMEGAPSKRQLQRLSQIEGWVHQKAVIGRQIEQKVQERVIAQFAETRARHAQLGVSLQGEALEALELLDLSKLSPAQLITVVIQFARVEIEIERKALGMDSIRLDLESLTDGEIALLLRMGNKSNPAMAAQTQFERLETESSQEISA